MRLPLLQDLSAVDPLFSARQRPPLSSSSSSSSSQLPDETAVVGSGGFSNSGLNNNNKNKDKINSNNNNHNNKNNRQFMKEIPFGVHVVFPLSKNYLSAGEPEKTVWLRVVGASGVASKRMTLKLLVKPRVECPTVRIVPPAANHDRVAG